MPPRGRGRPPRAEVYERLRHALDDMNRRFGGLPSRLEAEGIWRDIWREEVHNSTAIEGNTLVQREVDELLDRGVTGARRKDLAEYRACTSDGRTDASRRAPSDVASIWRVMFRSTRAAVVGRCGLLAARCPPSARGVVRELHVDDATTDAGVAEKALHHAPGLPGGLDRAARGAHRHPDGERAGRRYVGQPVAHAIDEVTPLSRVELGDVGGDEHDVLGDRVGHPGAVGAAGGPVTQAWSSVGGLRAHSKRLTTGPPPTGPSRRRLGGWCQTPPTGPYTRFLLHRNTFELSRSGRSGQYSRSRSAAFRVSSEGHQPPSGSASRPTTCVPRSRSPCSKPAETTGCPRRSRRGTPTSTGRPSVPVGEALTRSGPSDLKASARSPG